jgi:RNA polymerase sigma-70 factor (ECF subfamily)
MTTDRSPDDLLAAAQRGDLSALNSLVCAHRHGVYRYGLRVCRTTEDAEDAVQETLWAATRAIQSFRGSASSIVSWLFTIIRRECLRLIDRRRYSGPDVDSIEAQLIAEGLSPEDAALSGQLSSMIAEAIAELDESYREVIVLRDIREISAPEAAELLGISVDALKSRLHRARAELRERLLSAQRVSRAEDSEARSAIRMRRDLKRRSRLGVPQLSTPETLPPVCARADRS